MEPTRNALDRGTGVTEPNATPRLTAMHHVPLHERVYRELRDAIMTARLQPGEAVTLRGLAHELGTSAMPIRDAVHRLVSVAALEVLPNRTVRVPVLARERFSELTQVRRVLEGAAAEAAATRLPLGEIAVLEDINRSMEAAIRRKDVRAVFRENRAFHFAIYRSSANQLLVSMIEDLWLLCGPYLSLSWQARNEQKTLAGVVSEHHRELLRALKRRDGAAAATAVLADIEAAAMVVLRSPLFAQTQSVGRDAVAPRRIARLGKHRASDGD